MLASQAGSLVAIPTDRPLGDELDPFLGGLEATGMMLLTANDDIDTDTDTNTFVYVGMDYALFKATQAPTGKAPGGARLSGPRRLDDLFERADQENVHDLSSGELAELVRETLRPLAYLSILGNPELVKRLLPSGSPEASRFAAWVEYDSQGNPTVTLPPPSLGEESGEDPASWNSLVVTLIDEGDIEGSQFGEVVEKIYDEVEGFEFQDGD